MGRQGGKHQVGAAEDQVMKSGKWLRRQRSGLEVPERRQAKRAGPKLGRRAGSVRDER
jgi:hypothetical protein